MNRVLIFLLLAAHSLSIYGQTIQVTAGDSSLLNATGGQVSLYTPRSTSSFGVGIAQGHLVASAQTRFDWRTYSVTAGDFQQYLFAGDLGTAVSVRGISVGRDRENEHFRLFTGMVGSVFSTPYFTGAVVKDFGIGASYERHMGRFDLASVAAVAGKRRTAVQSVRYQYRGLHLSGAGGLLESQWSLTGNALVQLRHIASTFSRSDYVFNSQHATVNSAGAFAYVSLFDVHANVFQSGRASGESFGGGVRIGLLQVRADEFLAHTSRIFSGSVSERLSRRFTVAQYVSRSGGRTAVNFGGTYTANLLSASVSYSQQFNPFGGLPFQKVLGVTISLQLPFRGTNVNLATFTSTGGTKYTSYATTYIETGGFQATSRTGKRITGFLITGEVLDGVGAAVDGAAVLVGGQLVFTDSQGRFQCRFKKDKPVTVSVPVGDFSTPGNWELVSSPAGAAPGQPISIVVRRSN